MALREFLYTANRWAIMNSAVSIIIRIATSVPKLKDFMAIGELPTMPNCQRGRQMSDLRTALQSRLDRYRAQYRDGAISAAEFRRRLVMLPYVRLDEVNND